MYIFGNETIQMNPTRVRPGPLGLVLMLTLVPIGETMAQESAEGGSRVTVSEVIHSSAVPQGEVRGIVVDANSGEPLTNIHVIVMGRAIEVVTDSSGLFSIGGLDHGTHVLRAVGIPYASGELAVIVHGDHPGFVARFALVRRVLPPNCGLVVSGRAVHRVATQDPGSGSILVVVRDVLSQRAPTTTVALRVRRDSLRFWDFGRAEEGDSAVVLSTGFGQGLFAVDVGAAGYAPWYQEGVRVRPGGECQGGQRERLEVWLLPWSRP